MIPRLNRFHGHNSLRTTYNRGSVVRGPLCSVKYVDNPKRKTYRMAVVVSKKVCKSAVVRNRIRRRIFESVRQQTLVVGAYDVVVTVFSDQIAEMDAAELSKVLQAQFHQAGLNKNQV